MKIIDALTYSAACAVLLFTSACTPMRYSEFAGRSKVWPVSGGSMAERQYNVPVYRGWPEKPYIVIGSIRFVDPNKYWDDGIIKLAADMAKDKGGDAIIMRAGSEFGVGMTTGAVGDPKVFSQNQITALAIRWKTDAELAAEAAQIDRLLVSFRQRHSGVSVKRELMVLGAEYVHWLGLDLNSPAAEKSLEDALLEVTKPANADASRWLFRGTVRASSLTSSATDTVLGIATVSRKGEAITIVSTSEKSEVNFSGSLQEGRVSGQLGFSAGPTIISAKAEGVFTESKISLTGQGHTADGTFQGSFSFNR
jgi:hypothetical protein